MAILPIYVMPHPVLKTRAEDVAAVDDDIRRLLDDMVETMYDFRGVGLAAPQVGVSKRVIVIDVDQRAPAGDDGEEDEENDAPPTPGRVYHLINPEIVWVSEDMRVYNEGCLSIPAQYADVERPDRVRITYLDRDGNRQELEAGGLLATCIQHEIDHINGVLFTDHISSLKRDMLARKLKKWIKDHAEDLDGRYIVP